MAELLAELARYQSVAERVAREAGAFLREQLGRVTYREKQRYDLVTEADTAAQALIERQLLAEFPDHGFLGEEGAASTTGETHALQWIVDPIDGTTNFVHQVPMFCVSMALATTPPDERLLCGVIYNPISDEMFSATLGGGAFLNGATIRSSNITTLEHALVSVSFPAVTDEHKPPAMKMLMAVIPQTQAIRRTGSTALNLAYVAAGRFDACWGFSANAWDFGAGALLVSEAGGVVTTTRGETERFLQQKTYLAAATPELHRTVLDLMRKTLFG